MQSIDKPKLETGTKIKYAILRGYPEYIQMFPNYTKALDIVEYLMNQDRFFTTDYNKYDNEIIYAIEHEPEMTIILNPEKTATFLSWNSDYYFDRYFIDNVSFKGRRNEVNTLETLADTSANLKFYFAVKLHEYLYKKTNYYKLCFIDALKLKQTFPITQLMNRIRDYFQIPVIKFQNDDSIEISREIVKEKVLKDPENPDVKKYIGYANTFETKSGIKLTTDEKIEFIVDKVLDKLITDDYDEIES
jgi:hypothetical protein